MHRETQTVCLGAFLLAILFISSFPSRAQIASITDASGRTVYINANPEPAPRPASRRAKHGPTVLAGPQKQGYEAIPAVAKARTQGQSQTPTIAPSAPSAGAPVELAKPATSAAASAAVVNTAMQLPPFDKLVQQTATQSLVDPRLVHAIIQVESEYNPHAVSPKGAIGLMQLMPSTAKGFGVSNPFDPEENVRGGVTYLRHLLDLFGGDVPLSLAAYNAGENAVLKADGIPHFEETQTYVRRVTERYGAGEGKLFENPFRDRGAGGPSPQAAIYSYLDAWGIVHYSQ